MNQGERVERERRLSGTAGPYRGDNESCARLPASFDRSLSGQPVKVTGFSFNTISLLNKQII